MAFISTAPGEKPFDFASTPGKLPKHILPQKYAIRVTPHVDEKTFTGSVAIAIEVKKTSREVVLNAADLEISRASINGKELPQTALKLDEEQQLLTLVAPAELNPGRHEIELSYTGKINQAGYGLFYAPYQDVATGENKVMLGTQFEATDARRMFPCWDEPVFRARFQLTAIVPTDWTAVSNMPVEHEKKVAEGKEVRFGTTPLMPAYLNVLCAGELDFVEDEAAGVKLRIFATKGKAQYGRYALESTKQILTYYNDYFGVPYPLPKLDQIALPGGFSGAMENWGGITYFESVLLYDPERSSENTKQNIYEVIAHEIAHQWFGNLVTMAWWDNLWLNEGFASWMGSKCTANFNPQWEVWLRSKTPRDPTRRPGISKESSMEGDARTTTNPIQRPIRTEAEAGAAFDEITYNKGQSFIRMLEVYLGEDVFRDGIRRYIKKHTFSNTTTADLWAALGEASGKPITEIAPVWTEQPGFPLVSVTREGDGTFKLAQERLLVRGSDQAATIWPIPVTYAAIASDKAETLLMRKKEVALPLRDSTKPFKLNVDGAGNYRVQYSDELRAALYAGISELSVADRVNLLGDSWALVVANRAPLSQFLEVVEKLPTLTELAEREQIITALTFIDGVLNGAPEGDVFRAYARGILQPSLEEIGWKEKKGEPPMRSTLRARLLRALGAFRDEEVIGRARERFVEFQKNPASLNPDLRPAVFHVVGQHADEKTWERLHQLGRDTRSVEEKQNYYDALAAARDPQLARRALQISLTDELPTSRALYMLGKVARYGGHPDLVWEFARANMKPLLAKADTLAVNRFAPGLFVVFNDEKWIEELHSYAAKHLPPASKPAVEKAVDEIAFRSDFRERLRSQVEQLKEAKPVLARP